MTETAVSFKNPVGHVLHGVLHTPEEGVTKGSPGVVWLSAGQKDRVGAWRMNVVVARRLAKLGVPTLRFDFHGIGDSEGERPHGQFVMDLYGHIQTGGFKDDVVAATDFVTRTVGVSKIVLGGLCGGAISGLFAGPMIQGCYGHVLVDLPVTISSAARQKFLEENPVELLRTNPLEAETVLILYGRKAMDLAAWRRLLSGESDYRLLGEALRQRVRACIEPLFPRLPGVLRGHVDRVLKPLPAAVQEGADPGANTAGDVRNEMVASAFRACLAAGQRVRFLNSSTYHPTFMAYFGQRELSLDCELWKGYDLTVAPDTNHIFSLEASQTMLFGAIESMVRESSGVGPTIPGKPCLQT